MLTQNHEHSSPLKSDYISTLQPHLPSISTGNTFRWSCWTRCPPFPVSRAANRELYASFTVRWSTPDHVAIMYRMNTNITTVTAIRAIRPRRMLVTRIPQQPSNHTNAGEYHFFPCDPFFLRNKTDYFHHCCKISCSFANDTNGYQLVVYVYVFSHWLDGAG